MVVLLPAPLGPSSPTISPRPTEKEIFDSAVWPAYRLVRLATSIIKLSLIAATQCAAYPIQSSLGYGKRR